MPHKVISRCPVCSNNLTITRLECKKCGTIIQNEFELSKFAYLNKEQLDFAEVFLKCRGNIKDVEKELGMSYPTVRAKLDDVIIDLGYAVDKKIKNERKDILDVFENRQISLDETNNLVKK